MAWRQINVDEEVYTALGKKAEPFVDSTPNDVLRRILLLDSPGPPSPAPPNETGDLKPLIDRGALVAGERLVHRQPRKGRTFYATVTQEGFIKTDDGRLYKSPSPALQEYVGHAINGWANWTVERTGETLASLRTTP